MTGGLPDQTCDTADANAARVEGALVLGFVSGARHGVAGGRGVTADAGHGVAGGGGQKGGGGGENENLAHDVGS